uniref:DUF7746 domain-containing protein n=1 Tax=Populus trichocarpa TaxID=3694 RepID=A0A2K1WWL3_POPTR
MEIFEYNILNTLQQMTMTANAYKTQIGTSDKAIVELLIAGFSRQLKGWWDHFLDSNGNTTQNAVSTFILTISLYFLEDPSHLKDKNDKRLSNLRYVKNSMTSNSKKKNTFLVRVILREDSNPPFWKEKFIIGLSTLLGERVRNKIKDIFVSKTVP